MVGRMYTRVLHVDSLVVNLLVHDVHERAEHFLSASASEYHLLQSGLYFKGAKKKTAKVCSLVPFLQLTLLAREGSINFVH